MQTYGNIFGKVILGFLALYILMMGIFTYSKQSDVRKVYKSRVFEIRDNVQNDIKSTYTSKDIEEGDDRTLNERITRHIQYTNEFKIYATTAVYRKGELINKSGYYLVGGGLDWYLNKVPNGERYIDLEKWMSKEELIDFVQVIQDAERKGIELIWLKVSGYEKGKEVYPSKIELYKIKQREDTGWHDEDAILTKVYEFDIEVEDNMTPYYLDDWRLVTPLEEGQRYYTTLERPEVIKGVRLDQSTYERLKTLEEDMYNWSSKDSSRCYEWENLEGIGWRVRHFLAIDVGIENERYFYRIALEYRPWLVAMEELQFVYLYALLMVIIMSLILTSALWKTEKKQQLLEKNRRILIDAIGHELKTPLGIILSYSEGLKEKIAEDKREHYIDVIMDETNRMNQLILEMLSLSKLESGAYKLRLEQFRINDLLRNCLRNKEKLFVDGQIQLQLKELDELDVQADYSCIEKVINNMLMNAINHTPVNGKIVIKVEGKKVIIENEGELIPEEKLTVIWRSFYKAENIENRSGEGTGLGLAIVKEILELHKWHYGVSNIDDGVSFWFEIK